MDTPLLLARGVGDVRFCCGALRAAFPAEAFLLNVRGWVEDIAVEDVAFDCGRRGGGVATDQALRVHLQPDGHRDRV